MDLTKINVLFISVITCLLRIVLCNNKLTTEDDVPRLITDNDNDSNCLDALNRDYSTKPNVKSFIQYIVLDTNLSHLVTSYGRLYLYFANDYFYLDYLMYIDNENIKLETMVSPQQFCHRRFSDEQKTIACYDVMIQHGYIGVSSKFILQNTILNLKLYDVHDNNVAQYMKDIFKSLPEINLNVTFKSMSFVKFCTDKLKEYIEYCMVDISNEFLGVTPNQIAHYALLEKKKSQLFTIYGEIYYDEFHDNIKPSSGMRTPAAFCNEENDYNHEVCFKNLESAGYDMKNDDSLIALLFTFYHVEVEDIKSDLHNYVSDIENNFVVSGVRSPEVFCKDLIKHELSFININPFD